MKSEDKDKGLLRDFVSRNDNENGVNPLPLAGERLAKQEDEGGSSEPSGSKDKPEEGAAKRRVRGCLFSAFILFAADQLSKYIIDSFVSYGASIKIIPVYGFFNITNVHNTGAAFSIFQGNNFAFAVLITVILSVIAVWFYFNANKITVLQKYAFCLVFAGGLGNLTDRIFRGAVVDFLDFGINSLRWPAFNVADSCVCAAAALIAIDVFKSNAKS